MFILDTYIVKEKPTHTVRFHATQKIRKITELKKIDFGKVAVFQKVFDVAKI